MKLNKREELEHNHHERYNFEQNQLQLEIIKAVAQVWHSRFNSAKEATSEFDAHRRNFRTKPSRFKLEAEARNKLKVDEEANNALWNFNHSLWDPHEIVAVSKRLESGLVIKYELDDLQNIDANIRVLVKKRKESKNSLRKLFNMISSSKRYDDNVRFFD